MSGQKDVDRAVEAAISAQPDWGGLTNTERSSWLDKIADALDWTSLQLPLPSGLRATWCGGAGGGCTEAEAAFAGGGEGRAC